MTSTVCERGKGAGLLPVLVGRQFIFISEGLKAHIRRALKSREVSLVKLSPGLRNAKRVAIITCHNEAPRIPFLLKYYKDMGFEEFIFVDNRSNDGLQQILSSETGVTIFFADGVYRLSRFGCDWVNSILSKYCLSKWVLYVDADEYFVFPRCDTKSIIHLTNFLEASKQISLPCLLLDMYSDKDPKYNQCAVGQDPLSVCRFYDKDGYIKKYAPVTGTDWIKGGVRGRIYFQNNLWEGPALNKTPLVFWQRHYAFLKSTHELWPFTLNEGQPRRQKLRGVLLHFKFLADWTTKVANESVRQQHTEEYRNYSARATSKDGEPNFIGEPTSEYVDWRSLERDRLLDSALWPV